MLNYQWKQKDTWLLFRALIFIFVCELMFSVLVIFAPANKLVQKEVTHLQLGLDLIQASCQVLQARKNSFDEFVSTLSEKYPQIFGTEDSETSREKRPRMLPRYFDNFVVTERLKIDPLSSLKIGKWHGRASIKQSLTRLKWKLTDDLQKKLCYVS